MKRLMSILLGLALAMGTVEVGFAKTPTRHSRAKKAKKSKRLKKGKHSAAKKHVVRHK